MNDLISIVVPIYNVEKYLPKCIDSIINQSYNNLEIILVDDGSPDNCPKICDEYAKKDNRIKVVHKKNGGLSDARNVGVYISTGKYITFIDSDDYYEIEAIETLYECLIENKSQISVMKSYLIDENYKIITNQSNNTNNIEFIKSNDYIKGMCEKKYSESVCDKLFNIELFKNNKFETGRLNEDFFFLSKLLMNELKIVRIDYSGYNYYKRKDTITKNVFGKSLIDSVKNGFELFELAKNNKPEFIIYFARYTLYQARTLFITMPYEYVKSNNEAYINTLKYMGQCLEYINKVNLSKSDKIFLQLVNILPKITIYLVQKLYKIKNILKK